MAIRDKYFTGSTVSRYLSPGEHSWDEAVYQSGKPVLDAELNLSQEINRELRRLVTGTRGVVRATLIREADVFPAFAFLVAILFLRQPHPMGASSYGVTIEGLPTRRTHPPQVFPLGGSTPPGVSV